MCTVQDPIRGYAKSLQKLHRGASRNRLFGKINHQIRRSVAHDARLDVAALALPSPSLAAPTDSPPKPLKLFLKGLISMIVT